MTRAYAFLELPVLQVLAKEAVVVGRNRHDACREQQVQASTIDDRPPFRAQGKDALPHIALYCAWIFASYDITLGVSLFQRFNIVGVDGLVLQFVLHGFTRSHARDRHNKRLGMIMRPCTLGHEAMRRIQIAVYFASQMIIAASKAGPGLLKKTYLGLAREM
ncbi:hypothetical protein FISHEDRAFT_57043 [Fistulina hepatica ATCC 64428]|nr:hypothetical protein FISHEDRAFT_57043 [Fistulina hepatica ATCC 64428]